jgi:hypothetical protein
MVLNDLWDYAGGVMLATIQQAGYDDFKDLPLGAVVGVCIYRGARTALGVSHMDGWNDDGNDERLFGDYSAGRWAWDLDLILRCDPPVPARGRQLLWEWEPPKAVAHKVAALNIKPAGEAGEETESSE